MGISCWFCSLCKVMLSSQRLNQFTNLFNHERLHRFFFFSSSGWTIQFYVGGFYFATTKLMLVFWGACNLTQCESHHRIDWCIIGALNIERWASCIVYNLIEFNLEREIQMMSQCLIAQSKFLPNLVLLLLIKRSAIRFYLAFATQAQMCPFHFWFTHKPNHTLKLVGRVSYNKCV